MTLPLCAFKLAGHKLLLYLSQLLSPSAKECGLQDISGFWELSLQSPVAALSHHIRDGSNSNLNSGSVFQGLHSAQGPVFNRVDN